MRIHSAFYKLAAGVVTAALCSSAWGLQDALAGTGPAGSSRANPKKQDCTSCLLFEDQSSDAQQRSQASKPDSKDSDTDKTVTLKSVFLNIPGDQKAIWTAPARLHIKDALWVGPSLATFGVLLGSDQHSMARARSNADAISTSNSLADAGVATMVAVPAMMYVLGSWQGHSREQETGLLSGEAVINSAAIAEAFKFVFARQRPNVGTGSGSFFKDPTNGSFPSMHATVSWTVASVMVHEYPGSLTQILAYGGAAAVSIARVTGRQHFPSDVVVGGALGWYVGHQVFEKRHNPALENPPYGSFMKDPKEFDPDKVGSPFVPLDSWVYPALERLAALGYVSGQLVGLRPWTRRECVRMIDEAEYKAEGLPPDSEIARMVEQLRNEFKEDGQSRERLSLDSVYTRYARINGPPLRDSYHFGTTVWNDFGRPFDEGNNLYTGASISSVYGRFFWYARGEYQHAPGRAGLTQSQQNILNNIDQNNGIGDNPAGPVAAPVSSIDRFYPLDMYAGLQMGQYAVTFGKQSLWLGPGESGALMVSDNADPMYMWRLTRTTPLVLPWIFKYFGEIRGEFLFGKLSGHQFPARPFFNLQKISTHVTKNLELGFTRASLWGGVGHPFTAHALERNFFALGDTPGSTFVQRNDIGDRKSGFDFSYRVPYLRNWLTVYSDMYSDDDPSPLANPRRAAVNPGLYLARVPRLERMDLRFEFSSTASLTGFDRGGDFIYWNFRYHDSNTNKGYIFGNQTGRDGQTYQGWITYHVGAWNSLQFGYRQTKIGNAFLNNSGTQAGGTQSDGSARLRWQVRPEWSVDAVVQYERWLIPLLNPTAQHDVLGSVQVTFTPRVRNLLKGRVTTKQ